MTCENRGSKLVDVKTSELNDKLNTELNARGRQYHYVIGATDIKVEGSWKWGDETNLEGGFEQWARNGAEPDGGNSQNCMTKNSDWEWEWVDVACSSIEFYLICHKNLQSEKCSADICSNHGTCSVSGSRYICECDQRYGSKCEKDPCKPNPCENGGTCSFYDSLPLHYKCSCTSSYQGPNCHERVFKTDGDCKYHINLQDKKNYSEFDAVCKKLSGVGAVVKSENNHDFLKKEVKKMFGTTREVSFWLGGKKYGNAWTYPDDSQIDESYSKWAPGEPSESGKRLVVKSSEISRDDLRWYAVQPSNTYGYVCEVAVNDPCRSNPCQNAGTCQAIGCQWQCTCKNGYDGVQCETDLLRVKMLQPIVYSIIGQPITISLNVQTEVGRVRLQVTPAGEEGQDFHKYFTDGGDVKYKIGSFNKSSAGKVYQIRATNISQSVERFVNFTLIVQDPANDIRVDHSLLAVPSLEGPFEVVCRASGFPLPNVTWYRADQPVNSERSYKGPYQHSSGNESRLNLQRANESHVGIYLCKATNLIGLEKKENVDTTNITVFGTPHFTAIGDCSLNITVNWKPGAGATIFTHKIEVSSVKGGLSASRNVTPSSMNKLTTLIENHEPLSNYSVKMFVCVGSCFSRPDSLKYVMTGPSLPDAVNDATVKEKRENKSCFLSWSIPNPVDHVTGFKIVSQSGHIYTNPNQPDKKISDETIDVLGKQLNYSLSTKPNRNYTFSLQAKTCAGYGLEKKIAGRCTSDFGPPDSMPSPVTGEKENDDNILSIKISAIDESNGKISCLFIIVKPGASENEDTSAKESEFATRDLERAHKNGQMEAPSDGKEYIAVASVNTKTTFHLGDGSSSSCDVTSRSVRRRKRSMTSYQGKNFPLEDGKHYSYFIVVSVPGDNNEIHFAKSSTISFKISDKGDNTILIAVIVAVVIFIIITIVLIVVWFRKKNSANKATEEHTMTTLNHLDATVYDNVGNAISKPDTTTQISLASLLLRYGELKASENREFISQFTCLKRAAEAITLSKDVALQPSVKKKNRYKNVLPYDNTRVILSGEGDAGYINACYIQGYSKRKKFIATQGPLSSTTDDFWRMVMEQGCTVIVMLTNCIERGKRKCEKYWPDHGRELSFGFITVKTEQETENGNYVKRVFQVSSSNEERRVVNHFHFTAWPDHGVPRTTSRLFKLFKAVSDVKTSAPIIVHCSAGAGRTGAYIAFDNLSEEGKATQCIDAYKCVSFMREQRVDMVQTVEQYILVHKLLLEEFQFNDTGLDESELRNLLNSKNEADGRIAREFRNLSLVEPLKMKRMGEGPKHREMNRNPDITPYVETRVIITRLPEETDTPYINASHIECYNESYRLIAVQGPLEPSVEYFWRAASAENVDVIVMLAQPNKEQCINYWPEKGENFRVGGISVTQTEEIEMEDLKKRKFKVQSNVDSKVVDHYQCTTWSPTKPPRNPASILKLVSKIYEYQQKTILIHCSDGAGRTGVLCAMINLIQQFKTENRVDVFRTVKDLRDCRPGMVQTLEEYRFLYDCLLAYLDTSNVYENLPAENPGDSSTEILYENVHFKAKRN